MKKNKIKYDIDTLDATIAVTVGEELRGVSMQGEAPRHSSFVPSELRRGRGRPKKDRMEQTLYYDP